MSIYDEFRALTADLLDLFGTPATVTTLVGGEIDFVTGVATPASTATKDCLAILKPLALKGDDGTVTFKSAAIMNVSAVDGDKLTIGGNSYTITDVQENAPDGGASIIYVGVLK